MNILHLSCSPNGQAAESHRLSSKIVAHLLDATPSASVIERDIANGGIAALDADYAHALGSTAPLAQGWPDAGTMQESEALILELESADVVVIGTPMHNFTVPAALKAWIDHIVRVHRTFRLSSEGKVGVLRDRPVLIAVASGGRFSGEEARQPDFLTGYLRAILATVGLHDLHFFSVQGTVLGAESLAQARAAADRSLQAYFTARASERRVAGASCAR